MLDKTVTIQDIAHRVGVSKTTISRYLNQQFEYMSEKTRSAIAEAIADLHYRPSSVARSLKSKQSRLIGIVLHSLENQVSLLFLRGICEVSFERDYSPMIFNCNNRADSEIQNLRACLDQRVAGIILSPSSMDLSFYESIQQSGTPVVMGNRCTPSWEYDSVYVDHRDLVRRAMRHLADNGYTRIAFITNNTQPISTKAWREEAYLDFLAGEAPGREPDIIRLPSPCLDLPAAARGGIAAFLQRYPLERKALVCADAAVLQASISAAHDLGIAMPAQLGLCGYDAWNWAALITPGITTMNQPLLEVGREAASLLLDRLDKKITDDPKTITLGGILEVRESSGRV